VSNADPGKQAISPARRHFLAAMSAASVRLSATIAFGGLLSSCKRDSDGDLPCLPCFLRGTHILTSKGETAVEDLSIGDLVTVRGGAAKPIRWIGHRAYDKAGETWQDKIRPIRISRGAIASQIPHRDLYLSPRHCLFLGGLLIEAQDLVNGISIVSEAPPDVERLDYFHVLLDTHDVIQAQGVETETLLLQHGGHQRFTNFREYERICGDSPLEMTRYAPVHAYRGGRSHIAALLRIAASRWIDVRDPFQREYNRLAARIKYCVV
jgi:hypothetical protein